MFSDSHSSKALVLDFDDWFGPGGFAHPPKFPSQVSLVRGHRLGEIRLESGKVVVADPYHLDRSQPLECPRGRFPVFLGASEMYGGHDMLGLSVRFAERPVAKWEPVFGPGLGIPVDSASVAICDADEATALKQVAISMPFQHRPLGGALFAEERVAACGLGSDGGYPLHWGLDTRGDKVRLVAPTRDEFVRWRYGPLPDLSRMEEVAGWLAQVQGKDRTFALKETPAELIRKLERRAKRWAPLAVREYYRHFLPWTEDADQMPLWKKRAPRGAFPLTLFPLTPSGYGGHVLMPDGVVREVSERGLGAQALDIPSWLVLYAITLYDLAAIAERAHR